MSQKNPAQLGTKFMTFQADTNNLKRVNFKDVFLWVENELFLWGKMDFFEQQVHFKTA